MTDNRNLLELTAAEKQDLERWAQSRTLPAGDVFRARLILALADGQSYREDGERHANECGYHRTLEKALRAGSVSRPGRPTSGQQTSHRHACGAGARGAARATAAERWKHALVVP